MMNFARALARIDMIMLGYQHCSAMSRAAATFHTIAVANRALTNRRRFNPSPPPSLPEPVPTRVSGKCLS